MGPLPSSLLYLSAHPPVPCHRIAAPAANNSLGRTTLECVTWGRIQKITTQFYKTYGDEAWAILSPEMLVNGKSLEGFDLAQLQADLKQIGNA